MYHIPAGHMNSLYGVGKMSDLDSMCGYYKKVGLVVIFVHLKKKSMQLHLS